MTRIERIFADFSWIDPQESARSVSSASHSFERTAVHEGIGDL